MPRSFTLNQMALDQVVLLPTGGGPGKAVIYYRVSDANGQLTQSGNVSPAVLPPAIQAQVDALLALALQAAKNQEGIP